MVDIEETRVEKLIPNYHKLRFKNKEEKNEETELAGLDDNAILMWRQLEKQANMANEQLEKALNIFQEWIDEYEDVRDMIITQKALGVMSTFQKLLLALDTEKQFLLINKRVETKESVDPAGQKVDEKFYRKKIALILFGEMGVGTGERGRGRLGTFGRIGNILGVGKKTVEKWIDEMIEDGYIEDITTNFKKLLEKSEIKVESSKIVVKNKEDSDKNEMEDDLKIETGLEEVKDVVSSPELAEKEAKVGNKVGEI